MARKREDVAEGLSKLINGYRLNTGRMPKSVTITASDLQLLGKLDPTTKKLSKPKVFNGVMLRVA